MTRLTRKEIVKEDQIHAGINRGTSFVLDHANTLLILVAIVLAGAAGFFFWSNRRASAESRAQYLLSEALESFHGQVPAAAENPPAQPNPQVRTFKTVEEKYQDALKRFDQIVREYPGSRGGRLARFYVALCQERLGRVDEAIAGLKQVVESNEREVCNLARNSLARLYRGKKSFQQAVDLYKAILADSESQFPDAAALLALGETYEEMGNRQEALNQYQRINREHASSSYRSDADTRIAALGQAKQ